MQCTKCGAENDYNSIVCEKCGNVLVKFDDNIVFGNNVLSNNIIISDTFNKIEKSNSKKFSMLKLTILVIVILFIVFGFYIMKIEKSKENKQRLIYESDELIPIKNSLGYGYVDFNGNIVIEPQYSSATDFKKNYSIVSNSQGEYKIIDKSGNILKTTNDFFSPQYIEEYDLWLIDGSLYNSSFNKISPDNISLEYIDNGYFIYSLNRQEENGIMNYKCEKIFTTSDLIITGNISESNYYKNKELFATLMLQGYYDSSKLRQIVISLQTGDILYNSDSKDKIITAYRDGIFYYNDDKNKKYLFFLNNSLVYESENNVLSVNIYNYKNSILKIQSAYNNSYYDSENRKMLKKPPKHSYTYEDFEEDLYEKQYGFKIHYSSHRYGIIKNNKKIIQNNYDSITHLYNPLYNYMKSNGKDLVLLKKGQYYSLYDLNTGKEYKKFKKNYILSDNESMFLYFKVYGDTDVKKGKYVNFKSNYIYSVVADKGIMINKDDQFIIGTNYLAIIKDNIITYYNLNLKEIYTASYI